MLNLINIFSLKRLPLLSQFHILLFYVLLFHVLSFGPSFSRPAFSAPPFVHLSTVLCIIHARILKLFYWPMCPSMCRFIGVCRRQMSQLKNYWPVPHISQVMRTNTVTTNVRYGTDDVGHKNATSKRWLVFMEHTVQRTPYGNVTSTQSSLLCDNI